ncbi:hypothetical protein [Fibrella aestuarina]|uniref:hypothetical protein n=1 Tax=Fibrella aestuarina TaxID=651143 RepID=UPI00059B856F|nr:hypothetical protein [Fibrella aestuarina]
MKVRNLSQYYLTLVPFVVAILGFALGHSSYKLYIPLWLINVCLMVWATRTLSKQAIKNPNERGSHLLISSLFLIAPWLFISVFAGMGPPPNTAASWVTTAAEQQVRYVILLLSGVLITIGFTFLRARLNLAGEEVYSLLGLVIIFLAMPLFMLNMTYWGGFLTESFRIFEASNLDKRPDWYLPLRELFAWISGVEVGLTYLATAAFGASLKTTRWFKPRTCWIYIGVSLLGFLLSVLPEISFMPLTVGSYLVSIPAIPFIMPYLIAVNLLSLSTTLTGSTN